jgi:Cd2+/Zn2+-exporting ATPase
MKEKRRFSVLNRDKSGEGKRDRDLDVGVYSTNILFLVIPLSIATLLLLLTWVVALPSAVTTVLEIVAFLFAGFGVFKSAVHCVLHKDYFNENILMSVAGLCAMCIGQPLEGILIMFLTQIGQVLQREAVVRAHQAIEKRLDTVSETVKIQTQDGIQVVPADNLRPGDMFMVFAGERIALDGVVQSGTSEVDASGLTGDKQTIAVGPGSSVASGSMNVSGAICIKATHTRDASAAAQVQHLVEGAKASDGEPVHLVTDYSRRYTPILFALALIIAIFLPLILKQPYTIWIHRALVLLVVACPCALIVSIPLAYFAGICGAAKQGILFKKASVIDPLAKARCVAFSKTGILTSSQFTVAEVRSAPGVSKKHLLAFAIYAEAGSAHPFESALLGYSAVQADRSLIASVEERSGRGRVIMLTSGQQIAAGNLLLMREQGISQEIEEPTGVVLHIAAAGRYCGCIVFENAVRVSAYDAIEALYACDVDKCILLTGDSKSAATQVAERLNLSEVFSSCLPAEKLRVIETYKRSFSRRGGGTVIYVGSGTHDASLLTAADVGIAMDAIGSEAAITVADVVATTENLKKVPESIRVAKSVRLVCIENIAVTLLVKLILIVFGLAGIATMWSAVLVDLVVSMLAIFNAMRCFKK